MTTVPSELLAPHSSFLHGGLCEDTLPQVDTRCYRNPMLHPSSLGVSSEIYSAPTIRLFLRSANPRNTCMRRLSSLPLNAEWNVT